MSVLWTICGAGRGVGKTRLARDLCAALPNSVYAKLGHGRRKADGERNFFTAIADLTAFIDGQRAKRRHIVVESNTAAARNGADVVIYLAAPVGGKTNVRADVEALRESASVRIEPASAGPSGLATEARAAWGRALSDVVPQAKVLESVLGVLEGQLRFTAGEKLAGPPAVAAGTKLWLEIPLAPSSADDGGDEAGTGRAAHAGRVMGKGLAALLAGVAETGSLSKAAAGAKMSYRYAWQLVHQAETHLGRSLLDARSGGRRGGGSKLSPFGRRLMEVFNRLDAETASFAARRLSELMKEASDA